MKQSFLSAFKKPLLLFGLITGLSLPAMAQTNVSGNVFNDVNRNTLIDAGENFSSLPAPLYVYLVRSNTIMNVATVAANGSYTLQATSGFSYTLELSTQSYAVGANTTTNPIDHNPPASWINTGENNSGTNTGGGDFMPDGIMQVTVGATPLVARNFGIACKKAGTSNSFDLCASEPSTMALSGFIGDEDPGGTWSYQSGSGINFDAGAGTIQLTSTATTSAFRYDIAGGSGCPASSSITTLQIRQTPVSNQSLSICAGDSVCVINSTIGSRTIYPNQQVCYTTAGTYTDTLKYASQYGCDSIVITNLTVNACGTVNINGRVFNDQNSNKIVDAGETFSSLPATMYIYLVNSNNIVVGVATVAANGSYTIQGSPNQNYTLKLSTQQYPLGTKTGTTPINTNPPSGWTTTGENGNNNTGSGDGTPDGSLALSLGTGSVNNQNFGIVNGTPLAVNLLSFNASVMNTGVQLDWVTASEDNNKGFGIERSSDRNNWTELGFVASKANSNETTTYRFTDKNAEQGKNFYRLKQMDLNGHSTYSAVAMITFNKANQVSVYPNPAKEALFIDGLTYNAVLSIRNTLGQELSSKAVPANGNTIHLGIAHLPAGVYYITIKNEDQKVMNQHLFIKQ